MANEDDAGAAQRTSGPGASGEGAIYQQQQQIAFADFVLNSRKINAEAITGLGTQYHYVVNDEAFFNEMQKHVAQPKMLSDTLYAAKNEFEPQIKNVLERLVDEAVLGLDKRAWPDKYTTHVKAAIRRMPMPDVKSPTATQIIVEMDTLENLLGTYEEFQKAFHHGALKATAKIRSGITRADRVDIRQGAVDESQLFVKSRGRRARYWDAVSRGTKKTLTIYRSAANYYDGDDSISEDRLYDENGNAKVKKVKIPVEGDWNETIDARITVWGDRAPEWGLLEHGQMVYPPYIAGIKPFNISIQWSAALRELWTEIVTRTWDEAIQKFISSSTNYYTDDFDPQPHTKLGFRRESYTRSNNRVQIVYRSPKGTFSTYENAIEYY